MLPPRGWNPPRGVRNAGTGSLPTLVTFLRLHPASECCPVTVAQQSACSPEVLRPLSATQPSRSTTPRPFLPGSRCALTLTMRLGAFLPRRPPWCTFNQARSRGSPFRACPDRDCFRLSAQPPLLRLVMPGSSAWLWPVRRARSPLATFASGVFPLSVGVIAAGFSRLSTPWLSWVLASLGLSPHLPCASNDSRSPCG